MRRYIPVVATIMGATFAFSSTPALAGNCQPKAGPCGQKIIVEPHQAPKVDPVRVHTSSPMDHLRSVELSTSPHVNITRVYGERDIIGLDDVPTAFTSGCNPRSTQYCKNKPRVAPQPRIIPRPVVMRPVIVRPPVVHNPCAPRVRPVAPCVAPKPAPIVQQPCAPRVLPMSPCGAVMARPVPRMMPMPAPQPPVMAPRPCVQPSMPTCGVSTAQTGMWTQPVSPSPVISAPYVPPVTMHSSTMQSMPMHSGSMPAPQPMMSPALQQKPQWQQIAGPPLDQWMQENNISQQEWERISDPQSYMDGSFSTGVICRKSANPTVAHAPHAGPCTVHNPVPQLAGGNDMSRFGSSHF